MAWLHLLKSSQDHVQCDFAFCFIKFMIFVIFRQNYRKKTVKLFVTFIQLPET